MQFLKNSAATLAAFTMVISPLAQGAQAQKAAKANDKARVRVAEYNYNVDKKAIQELLKHAGVGGKKRVTVGEFHAKMRAFYPATLRSQMDEWTRLNRNELMPEFEATTYKDGTGKERVRLILSKDGQTFTASYNPDSNAKFLKVNNVFLTKDDLKYHEQAIRKLVHGDKAMKAAIAKTPPINRYKKSISLSYEEFKRLTPAQRAEYLVRVRYVLENAQKVMTSYYGTQAMNDFDRDFFVQWLLGQEAFAAGGKSVRGAIPGDPCIVSGYLSQYGNDYSCGGTGPGRKALIAEMERFGGGRCTNGSVSCNPLVYGYKNGQAICVKTGKNQEVQTSTSQSCKNQSPLRKGTPDEAKDKKAIIESYLAAKGQALDLKFDDQGRVSQEQFNLVKGYLDELNAYIDKAVETCGVAPLSDIQKVRAEQESACTALALRKIELMSYPETPLPPPLVVGYKDCSLELPNSENVNGECICRVGDTRGTINEEGREVPACIPGGGLIGDDTKEECNKDQPRDEKTGECKKVAGACVWCKWAIGGLVFAGVAAAVYFITKDDDDDDKKSTAVDPCPPAPLICVPAPAVPPTPVMSPPPIAPIPSVAPPAPPGPEVIPVPVVTPFVESTSGTSTSTSEGVR